MAKYKITSLNYITAGKKQAFINVDIARDYSQPRKIVFLDSERYKHVFSLEQGKIEYINTEHIEKENEDPLSLEYYSQTIVLKEDQKHIKNVEAVDKPFIMLKTIDDIQPTLSSLIEFQNQTSAIYNQTFELEVDHNSQSNILKQTELNAEMLPMYDIRNLSIKSANKKKMQSNLFGTDQHVDIYVPTMLSGPINMCEANGYSYMLLNQTKQAPQTFNAYISDTESNSYYMQIGSRKLKTYAYSSLAELNDQALENNSILYPADSYADFLRNTNTDQDVSSSLLSFMQPKRNYNNLLYNYILDFNQSDKSMDFNAGDIYAANINIAKNIYDSTYTIKMNDVDTISNTRDYCSIGSMNNNIYLTYIDDVKYIGLQHNKSDEAEIIEVKVQKQPESNTIIQYIK